MMSAAPKIAFVHIPRTGGMTFGAALREVYTGAAIQDFYGDASSSVVNEKIERFIALEAAEKNAFTVLKGHFVYQFDRDLSGFNYVTLLRNPVDRLVSYYFYALRERSNYLHPLLIQRRMRLEQFLTSDLSIELDNYQVRAVSGEVFSSPRQPVGPQQLELAKRHLRDGFSCFGLAELFNESMQEFARAFGWRLPPLGRMNRAEYPEGIQLSRACMDGVRERNRFDLALYDYARELFMQRMDRARSAPAALM